MYISQKCGHKINLNADIVKIEADLKDLTKEWANTQCEWCEWRAWIEVSKKRVPAESDLPMLKGRQKREAYEARREYLTLFFGLLYDDGLKDVLKMHHEDQMRKLQIYHAWIMNHTDPQWWLKHRIIYHNVSSARPTMHGLRLFREYVADLLMAELESKG